MIVLQQPPIRVKPLSDSPAHEGFFAYQWENWLLDVYKSIATRAVPVSTSFAGTYAGGGTPKDVSVGFTLQQDCSCIIRGAILQTFVTAAPAWQLQIKIDSTIVVDTGTIGTWETTPNLVNVAVLLKGAHTAHVIWTAANANATLARADIIVSPTPL